MEDQIITEQIDVIVVGERRHELMGLMLEQELAVQEEKKKRTHSQYLELLGKLVGRSGTAEEGGRAVAVGRGGVEKFTKVILTDSFWLHLHFFVHDNRIFDPFTFDANRNNISICILAAAHHSDLTDAKAYLHQPYHHQPHQHSLPALASPPRDHQLTVKPETVIESKIYSSIHEVAVSGFPSVLALKITEEKRIME
jgi:hypothetical protein